MTVGGALLPLTARRDNIELGVAPSDTGVPYLIAFALIDDVLDAEINAKLKATNTSTASSKPPLTLLNARIDDALTVRTADNVTGALAAINENALPDEARADHALNAKIVRLIAKAIELKVAPANADFVLREATSRAAKSPEVAEGLLHGLEAGALTTRRCRAG